MTYRFATLEDVALLSNLNHQLIEDEGHATGLALPELADRMTAWLQKEYRAVIFEQEDQILAYALYCQGEQSAGERFIFLRQFFVQRKHRRQGIGRAAISLLLEEIFPPNARVLLDVHYHNESGRAFWKALGFTEHCLTLERRTSFQ